MNLKDYIKSQINLNKQANLELIYNDLINLGKKPEEIYNAINEQIKENIEEALQNYLKNKDDK